MTCVEAGRLSHQAERERFRAMGRAMRAELSLSPAPALNPPLVLTARDRIGTAINQGEK